MPSMQKARRQDPYPWTWEVPALVAIVLMLGLAVGVQVGRSLANLLSGAGWTWPIDQATFWRSLPAVAAGDASAGLAAPWAASSGHASPALLWTGIGLVETLLLIAAGWAGVWSLRRWGPARLKGMATRPEAEQMLGLTRLRKVAGIVRPDLHGKHPASPRGTRRHGSRDLGRAPARIAAGSSYTHPVNYEATDPTASSSEPGRGLSERFLPKRTSRNDSNSKGRRS